eukprot:Gb_09995 [translate_table: standard]
MYIFHSALPHNCYIPIHAPTSTNVVDVAAQDPGYNSSETQQEYKVNGHGVLNESGGRNSSHQRGGVVYAANNLQFNASYWALFPSCSVTSPPQLQTARAVFISTVANWPAISHEHHATLAMRRTDTIASRVEIQTRLPPLFQRIMVLMINLSVTNSVWNGKKDYYQEGDHVYSELNLIEAYRKALQTWAKWVDRNINSKKIQVFFRGYSASHFSNWCLPGVPTTWNELLYASLLSRGVGVWRTCAEITVFI